MKGIAFGRGPEAEAIEKAPFVSLAYTPQVARWQEYESVELLVRDLRLG